ncbi:DUF4145 domain-containing protein [Cytobacillus firmus]|uniref:DUF4145 domain-containing protein n=1 Tax=Cytobacillus firmus TaxID=1399 RepID=UPI001CFD7046|nr:DUF4145 domain-containing protein [Cytobacillus firmus]
MSKIVFPALGLRSFSCPRCGVYCPQKLYIINYAQNGISKTLIAFEEDAKNYRSIRFREEPGKPRKENIRDWDFYVTICSECEKYAIWENQKMLFPVKTDLPDPADDMPENIKKIYIEAAQVFKHSPRSSSALLRLAIETLIPQLPDYQITKKRLVDMIGELVAQGIPAHIQKALDSIRLYGNQGIHTAEIVEEDNGEIGTFLFALINRIVKELISDKKAIDEFYNSFPESKLAAIEQRDR